MTHRFITPRWLWLLTLLLSWQSGPGYSQTARWVKLATSSSDADFVRLLDPQQHGLAVPELAHLTQWSENTQVAGDSLYRLLRSWQHYPKPRRTGIICRYEVKLDSTHTVPYLVYVPQHYDYRRPTKLLVYYKGGWLTRKVLPVNYAKEIVLDNPTFRYLDEQNTIELFPCLRQDLAIYGTYGYRHLQQMLAQTKRVLNIDDNRVYLSGFSDGGKTVFNVASLTPSAFACFYAINGGLASRPQFLNLAARPLLAFIAQADELISPASVLAYAEQARHFGADWQVRRLPARAHYYAPYQQQVLPALFAHLNEVSRNPFPTRVTYAQGFNSSDLTGLDWVHCCMSSTKAPAATHQVDSIRVVNMAGEVSRYRNGEKDGQVRATCFNNTYTVETSLVDELTIYVSPVMVDLTQPIRVVVNGQQRYQGLVAYSKKFLVQRFATNFDRQQLFVNELIIKI